MGEEKFSAQIIAQGSLLEDDLMEEARKYHVRCYTIRANRTADKMYTDSVEWRNPEDFDTWEQCRAYRERQRKRRETWERMLLEHLGITGESVCVTRVLSEIFTVVAIDAINLEERP